MSNGCFISGFCSKALKVVQDYKGKTKKRALRILSSVIRRLNGIISVAKIKTDQTTKRKGYSNLHKRERLRRVIKHQKKSKARNNLKKLYNYIIKKPSKFIQELHH
jgi:hypothetical protein